MTIDEAIKEQKDYLQRLNLDIPYKVRRGMELGIEALKQVVDNRVGPRVIVFKPLPGETKE